ncbi:MAG: IS607 family transposase [Thermocladium sp.]|nr:MAG: hypothetical protein AT710_09340 [Thermocladium sp. ECH_B]
MERLLRPKETCQLLSISYSTLLRWIREGKMRAVMTEGGKYRIPYSEVKKYLERRGEVRAVIYARVSSADQEDLERQINYLTSYATAKGYKVVDVIKDVASGLNTQRKGLLKLFKLVEERNIDVILITHKDRLTRFGFEYLEEFFSTMGVRIEAILGEEPKDATQELVEDLISIITSFTGKIYGIRSHKKTLLVQGVKKLMGELNG